MTNKVVMYIMSSIFSFIWNVLRAETNFNQLSNIRLKYQLYNRADHIEQCFSFLIAAKFMSQLQRTIAYESAHPQSQQIPPSPFKSPLVLSFSCILIRTQHARTYIYMYQVICTRALSTPTQAFTIQNSTTLSSWQYHCREMKDGRMKIKKKNTNK